jgi:hypothetical protein
MEWTTRLAAGALLMAGVITSGCGGATSSADPQAIFAAGARAICATGAKELAALPAPSSSGPRAERVRRVRAALGSAGRTRDRLGGLNPPAELSADFVIALAAIDALHDLSRRDLVTAKGKHRDASTDSIATEDTTRAARLTRSLMVLGIPECAAIGRVAVRQAIAASTTGDASIDAFVDDVQGAIAALSDYGDTVNQAGGPSGLRTAGAELKRSADAFEAAVASMGRYALDDDTLDRQRARIVDGGRPLAELMRDIATTAQAGEADALAAAARRFETAAEVFAQMVKP